jgi:Lrp/AsnC family leucine-responsive transcriptional regulator
MGTMQVDLDTKDLAILEALQTDGRIPLSELGRQIGLSQPAISERVHRLEDRRIIIGYGARVDPRAIGLTSSAIIRLRTTHEHIAACLKRFSGMPEVIDVYRVTGEDCFVIRAIVSAPDALEGIVDGLARFGAVTTSVILRTETPKPIRRELVGSRSLNGTASRKPNDAVRHPRGG